MIVAIAINNLKTNGSRFIVLDLINYLHHHGYKTELIVSNKGGNIYKDIVNTLDNVIIIDERASIWKPLKFIHWFYQSWASYRQLRAKIVHSFNYTSDFWEALMLKLTGRKFVYTKTNMQWKFSYFLKSLFSDTIVALNKDQLHLFFGSILISRKTVLIYNGVDIKKFTPGDSKLRNHQLKIAFVANLIPLKGHMFLLDVASRIDSLSNRQVKFYFAGNGSDKYYQQLKTRVDQLNLNELISFKGFVDDIPALLTSCDITVLPTESIGEACPMAVLESMACGLPVMVSDVAGSRDLIDNECGWILEVNNVELWSSTIVNLLNNGKSIGRKGDQSRKKVVTHFTRELMLEKHLQLYESLQ